MYTLSDLLKALLQEMGNCKDEKMLLCIRKEVEELKERLEKMRVRFEFAGNESAECPSWNAECDLTPIKARKRFAELKIDALCKWAELVAEDDEEGGYMEVIDSFDKTYQANQFYRVMKGLGLI